MRLSNEHVGSCSHNAPAGDELRCSRAKSGFATHKTQTHKAPSSQTRNRAISSMYKTTGDCCQCSVACSRLPAQQKSAVSSHVPLRHDHCRTQTSPRSRKCDTTVTYSTQTYQTYPRTIRACFNRVGRNSALLVRKTSTTFQRLSSCCPLRPTKACVSAQFTNHKAL